MPPDTTERTDLLVIGGGLAGMTAALVAAAGSDVVLRPGREAVLELWQ